MNYLREKYLSGGGVKDDDDDDDDDNDDDDDDDYEDSDDTVKKWVNRLRDKQKWLEIYKNWKWVTENDYFWWLLIFTNDKLIQFALF